MWTLLAAITLLYQLTCGDGELLSQQADRWIVKYPVLPRLVVAVLALHTGNFIPDEFDVLSHKFWRRWLWS